VLRKTRRAHVCFCLVGLVPALGLLPGFVPLSRSQAAPSQQSRQEEALKRRAIEFYSLLQAGSWSQAEAYVAHDSLETFRNELKNPFLGFQVDSVKIDSGGNAGAVTAELSVLTPFSATPFAFPQTTRWRLVNGVWYLDLPKPNAAALQNLFAHPPADATLPPPEDLKFKERTSSLGVLQPGEVKTAKFAFTNVADHEVTISKVLTYCPCLKVKTKKMAYAPGESGELAIEFNSADFGMDYAQTIVVKTDPGNRTAYLTITAFVHLKSWPAPKTQSEKKSKQ
jgi:Protein of unknown function (DUF1573)